MLNEQVFSMDSILKGAAIAMPVGIGIGLAWEVKSGGGWPDKTHAIYVRLLIALSIFLAVVALF